MAKQNPLRSIIAYTQKQTPAVDLRRLVSNHEGSTANSSLESPVDLGHRRSQQQAKVYGRSHWDSVDKVKNCTETNCRKKLSRSERGRNCNLCGKVFCKRCSAFLLRLTEDGQVDPLRGTAQNVCRACHEKNNQDLFANDWTRHLNYFREQKRHRAEELGAVYVDVPISAALKESVKRDRILVELKRLTRGFLENQGLVKDFMADFKTPSWQKSRHWVNSKQKTICQGQNCSALFSLMASKINCRICGQVYCSQCAKEEIVLYRRQQNGNTTIGWFINGKEGGPLESPKSFVNLPMCNSCCDELEVILLEQINEAAVGAQSLGPRGDTCEPEFMDSLAQIHSSLCKMKVRVDDWLPKFAEVVDTMDIAVGCPKSSKETSPIAKLAKSTCELSDQFTQLAMESQLLRRLHPTTPIQTKLLKHVSFATYQYYNDKMEIFRLSKKRLELMMPVDTIQEVQKAINRRSLQSVHLIVKQVCYEAINIELNSQIPCDAITRPLSQCVDTIEDELEELYRESEVEWEEQWKQNGLTVSMFIKQEISNERKKLKMPKGGRDHFRNQRVMYKLFGQCSSYLQTALRELDAKTPMTAFPHSKGEMHQLADDFDSWRKTLSETHPQVLQKC